MLTTWVNKKTVEKNWYIVDASNLVLGRLASFLAVRLMGKHKSNYCPNIDCGDHIVVINAKNVKMTGNKLEQKILHKHTGYPGGLKEQKFSDLIKGKNSTSVVRKAVERMMSSNALSKKQLSNLKIFNTDKHNLEAQKPENIDFASFNRKNSVTQ